MIELAVYCPRRKYEPIVRNGLRVAGVGSAHSTRSRLEFERRVARAGCAIAVMPDVSSHATREWAEHLAGLYPIPWMLVTELNAANARKCLEFRFPFEVVWLEDPPERLAVAIGKALCAGVLSESSRPIIRTQGLDPELGTSLVEACGLVPPPKTVQRLCLAVAIAENRVRYLWRSCTSPSAAPKAFVNRLILGTAVARYSRCRSWARVAESLGMRKATLEAICFRLMGCRLEELGSDIPESLVNSFSEWWAHALAG